MAEEGLRFGLASGGVAKRPHVLAKAGTSERIRREGWRMLRPRRESGGRDGECAVRGGGRWKGCHWGGRRSNGEAREKVGDAVIEDGVLE
ncbi:transmembrane protein 136-like [Pyrus ussuriensis x Pyrus communis]|uniref:Transmembrane protein 136-like n=1 Tax=Pyrus ussuriensis x Pyrus communis TaxID=2448454 RepID=A0A5N5G6R1_9ROSA|nr:transmembrane protein 136-like [Pyrus ussuriensis x Pyrus communis]